MLAEAFRVVNSFFVGAAPGGLCPAKSVVAVDTHALCVVWFVRMRTLVHFALLETRREGVPDATLYLALGHFGFASDDLGCH